MKTRVVQRNAAPGAADRKHVSFPRDCKAPLGFIAVRSCASPLPDRHRHRLDHAKSKRCCAMPGWRPGHRSASRLDGRLVERPAARQAPSRLRWLIPLRDHPLGDIPQHLSEAPVVRGKRSDLHRGHAARGRADPEDGNGGASVTPITAATIAARAERASQATRAVHALHARGAPRDPR